MIRTEEQGRNHPLSQAITQALQQTAEEQEILQPFYRRRPGESDKEWDERLNDYSLMAKEEKLRLAKEYQKNLSAGK